MDGMEVFKSWLSLLALAISVGSSLWMIVSSGAKKTAGDLADFKKQDAEEKATMMTAITRLGERVQSLEGEMRHLPTRESQHRIEVNMEKMNGRLDVLTEALKPIKANAELVNDLLREQVKK